jgi:hypothetical protein
LKFWKEKDFLDVTEEVQIVGDGWEKLEYDHVMGDQ